MNLCAFAVDPISLSTNTNANYSSKVVGLRIRAHVIFIQVIELCILTSIQIKHLLRQIYKRV